MNLRNLNNHQVLEGFSSAVKSERKVMHIVLEYIVEVERRKLYLDQLFPSMLEFMICREGYSRNSAQRRIDGARLLRVVPALAEKIEKGSVNLSQLSQVQQAVRFSERETKCRMSPAEKSELIAKIENTTQKQTDIILAQELNFTPPVHCKETYHRDESMTLTLPFSKEEMLLLEEARDLASNSVPGQKWNELVVWLARKYVKSQKTTRTISEKQNEPQTSTATVLKVRTPLKTSMRKFVLKRDQCCQYRDATTGNICGSRKYLQIDHIQPIWAGGGDNPENLQVLCSQHNNYRYQKQAQMSFG